MSKTNPGRFFEDFRLGQVIAHATPRTVTTGDVAVYTALHYRKQVLRIAIRIRCGVKPGNAAVEPAVGAVHRIFRICIRAIGRRAFVKRHNNIGTNGALNIHNPFRCKKVLAAVDMAAEQYAFFCNLAVGRQRKHLVAAAVGEQGTVPAVEAVQPACFLQHVHTRPQVKMIRIAQDDFGIHHFL